MYYEPSLVPKKVIDTDGEVVYGAFRDEELIELGEYWISGIPERTIKPYCVKKCLPVIAYKAKTPIIPPYKETSLYLTFKGTDNGGCGNDDGDLYEFEIDMNKSNCGVFVSYKCSNNDEIVDVSGDLKWLKLISNGRSLYLAPQNETTKKNIASLLENFCKDKTATEFEKDENTEQSEVVVREFDYEHTDDNNFSLANKNGKWTYNCKDNEIGSKDCTAFYWDGANDVKKNKQVNVQVKRDTDKLLTINQEGKTIRIEWKCECKPKKRMLFFKSKTKKKCKCTARKTRKLKNEKDKIYDAEEEKNRQEAAYVKWSKEQAAKEWEKKKEAMGVVSRRAPRNSQDGGGYKVKTKTKTKPKRGQE